MDGYTFSALRGYLVPKKDPTKFRMICVPTIKMRVVQRALLRVIESKAVRLRIANDVSFGFVKTRRHERGTVAARARRNSTQTANLGFLKLIYPLSLIDTAPGFDRAFSGDHFQLGLSHLL